ncbi:hypothetical protein GOODEAATRI_000549 [Goodea atripinnis]|uniref:Uncharacterized protein n=1 Tax=Goodea atripinnis TaxID=208336 RepID=A0ABV0NGH2_9TELE
MNKSTRYTNTDSFVLNSVHLIDDRMTPLDPVEELCLFASKETLARCASLSRPLGDPGRRDQLVGEGCSYTVASWEHRCYSLLGCAGSRLNALYFESFRKVHTGVFMLHPWLWVPTHITQHTSHAQKQPI